MNKISLLSFLAILPVLAQDPPKPKFELADVHVSGTRRAFAVNYGVILRDGRFVLRDVTMVDLISTAYGNMAEDNIAGGPPWVASDLFDVIAKVPPGTTLKDAGLMMRSLLEERFQLVAQQGTRPKSLYALTVGTGESKLKPTSGAGKGCQVKQQPGREGPMELASVPNIKVSCHNLTAGEIAQNLNEMARGDYLDRNVANATQLEGSWDFDLEWTPHGALAAKGSDGISIFDAVDKQLGLKLVLRDFPRPVLAIESVNRKPTPNPPSVETALALAAARFEVASIKPADPAKPGPQQYLDYKGGSEMEAGGTLRGLIALSLQVAPNVALDTVIGLPKSADSQRWDITAKLPSTGDGAPYILRGRPQPPALSVQLEMLRGFLVDEFDLKTHTENREVTVYALVTSGKPKLTQGDDSQRSGCRPDVNAPKPVPNMGTMASCKNTSMAELAEFLQQAGGYIDHPVVDATGLQGGWNFLVGWTPRGRLQPPPAPNPNQPAGAIAEASDPSGISLFEAVQRELGLKLVKQTKSVPVIVVDHVNEKPKD